MVWAISIFYPLIRLQPLMSFETWEARKVLDYGFFNRHGAAILGPGRDRKAVTVVQLFNFIEREFGNALWI